MEAFYGFADANAEFKEAKYVIFYLPYDRTTTHRKGTSEGPQAICRESWNFESWDLKRGIDLSSIRINDWGAIKVSNKKKPKQMVKEVYKIATKIVGAGKFPLLVGGEHTGSIGVILALSELREDFGVIQLDAHLDYRMEYKGERFNHACVARRIAEQIGPERIALIGIRSASKEEIQDAKKDGLYYFTQWDITKKGIKEVVKDAISSLGTNKIYLTFDMDGIDPTYAPGVSTPEPFGLTDLEGLSLIEALAPHLIGFDLMEVCPGWDKGLTSCLAAKFIREVIMLNHGTQKSWKHKVL